LGNNVLEYVSFDLLEFHMNDIEQPSPPQNTELTFPWLTIPSLVEFTNEEVTENQIRWWLRSKSTNGLDKCTRIIGRKIYINKNGFMDWFAQGVTA